MQIDRELPLMHFEGDFTEEQVEEGCHQTGTHRLVREEYVRVEAR